MSCMNCGRPKEGHPDGLCETYHPDLSILADHLKRSKTFSSLFADFETSDVAAKEETTKQLTLGILSETVEALNAINWKVHHKEKFPMSRSNLIEQLIDIYKYNMSLMALWGVSAQELCDEFDRKDLVNWQRYRQAVTLETIKASPKVVALDIDGVLSTYPENFLAYANKKLDRDVRVTELRSIHGVEEAYAETGIQTETVRMLRGHFVEEGLYAKHTDAIAGASEFTQSLKALGYTIVLLSARPYRDHLRIFADTIEFCQANKIAFDIILWDKEKDLRIMKSLGKISFLLDDDPAVIRDVSQAGYRAFLLNRPYNAYGVELKPPAERVFSFNEVLDRLKNDKTIDIFSANDKETVEWMKPNREFTEGFPI